ncbi:hypothetical protein BN59_01106 [Legionella massiliensis]|uniref:Uncharacterized protein n=1 Tax=Legionella massiliensis TaxID=1034943 RepID=A0A078KQY8_9GAMM|nr:MbcA/ParS/Xre antitoxin family protein [Legionella massiliensis]CDZ76830.1 hypothetical protein BN59_01106 [Legionella massiliensis]CEE12568.1 hypothetical protein BN1094_01106 [Legionella massiliensis]
MNIESKPSESQVLATALDNLKNILDISNNDISEIIGMHRNTLSRSLSNKKIDYKSKEGECSLLLIRAYRSLFALNGGNIDAMKHWLRTNNRHIQGVPLEAMKTVLGLSRVVNYLDAIRGKI